MQSVYHHHDISDTLWQQLEPHLPGRKGAQGVTARDNRLFINAVFWILHTGSTWKNLPPNYGDWKNTYRRFCRWRDKGNWEKLLEILLNDPDFEWLMIDTRYVDTHPYTSDIYREHQNKCGSKRKLTPKYGWPWMRMVCRSKCLLQQLPAQIAIRLAGLSKV